MIFDPLRALTGQTMLAIEGPKAEQEKKLSKLDEKTKDTKWSEYWEKNFQTPMFHTIPKGISQEELEYVTRLFRLDEIYKKV